MTLDEVATRFDRPVRKGAEVWAFCGAHPDGQKRGRRSLRIEVNPGTGWCRVKCWAGCPEEAVLRAAGLTLRDLAPPDLGPSRRPVASGNGPGLGPIVATFEYQGPGGEVLYRVTRHEPKDFRMWHQEPGGTWRQGLGGRERVWYHLPALRDASDIVIVEGEGKVERLAALPLPWPATTVANGAQSFARYGAQYAAQLVACGVQRALILPDNDPPGEAFAADVARVLTAAGIAVAFYTIPGLPPKGDVIDALRDGGNVAETELILDLWEAVRQIAMPEAPPAPRPLIVGYTYGALAALETPPEVALLPGLVDSTGSLVFGGEPKAGKSVLAAAVYVSLTTGLPLAGRFTPPQQTRVLLVAEEDRPAMVKARVFALLRGCGVAPDPAWYAAHEGWGEVFIEEQIRLGSPQWDMLERRIETFRPTIVIYDALRKFARGGTDVAHPDVMLPILEEFARIRRTYTCEVWPVHHLRKMLAALMGKGAKRGSIIDNLSGSHQLPAEMRTVVGLELAEPGNYRGPRILSVVGNYTEAQTYTLGWHFELAPDGLPHVIRLTVDDAVSLAHRAQHSRDRGSDNLDRVRHCLLAIEGGALPGITAAAIAAVVGLTRRPVEKHLATLTERGEVEEVPGEHPTRGGHAARLYRLSAHGLAVARGAEPDDNNSPAWVEDPDAAE